MSSTRASPAKSYSDLQSLLFIKHWKSIWLKNKVQNSSKNNKRGFSNTLSSDVLAFISKLQPDDGEVSWHLIFFSVWEYLSHLPNFLSEDRTPISAQQVPVCLTRPSISLMSHSCSSAWLKIHWLLQLSACSADFIPAEGNRDGTWLFRFREHHNVKDGKDERQEDHNKYTGDFKKTQPLLTFFLVSSFLKHKNPKPSPQLAPLGRLNTGPNR